MGIKGDYDRATSLLTPALATFRRLGDGWNIGVTLHKLGDNAREVGNWPEAIAAYQESLAHHWTQRDPLGVADALLRLAQILVASRRRGARRPLLWVRRGPARTDRHHGLRTGPLGYEQAVAAARAALGDDPFQAAGRRPRCPWRTRSRWRPTSGPRRALDRAAAPEPSSRLSAREREAPPVADRPTSIA